MEELKPCPFCLGEAELREVKASGFNDGIPDAWVVCRDCGTSSKIFYGGDLCDRLTAAERREIAVDKAATAWNRRANEVDREELLKVADELEEGDLAFWNFDDLSDRIRAALEV